MKLFAYLLVTRFDGFNAIISKRAIRHLVPVKLELSLSFFPF